MKRKNALTDLSSRNATILSGEALALHPHIFIWSITIFTFLSFAAAIIYYSRISPAEKGLSLQVNTRVIECATNPDPSLLDALVSLRNVEDRPDLALMQRHLAEDTINVDTYFHVVTTFEESKSVTPKMISTQYTVLNRLYAPYGIYFSLRNVTFTENGEWASNSDDITMKSFLRQGTYSSLNLYFQTNLSWNPLNSVSTRIYGFSSLPFLNASSLEPSFSAPANSSSYITDGCNVHSGTMPFGSIAGSNMGKTAVHEVGHWFGLLHTFWGESCDGPGDYVDDTAQERTATRGCPVGKNSCPGRPGVDPIANYMDYSDDSCYAQFTEGQRIRMFNMFYTFRQGL